MDGLFGSRLRTDVLIAIGRLGSSYISELARILDRRPIEIQRSVEALERAGAVVSRRLGTTRIVELNRRYRAKDELYALLLKLSEDPLYARRWQIRRRPRAIRKPL